MSFPFREHSKNIHFPPLCLHECLFFFARIIIASAFLITVSYNWICKCDYLPTNRQALFTCKYNGIFIFFFFFIYQILIDLSEKKKKFRTAAIIIIRVCARRIWWREEKEKERVKNKHIRFLRGALMQKLIIDSSNFFNKLHFLAVDFSLRNSIISHCGDSIGLKFPHCVCAPQNFVVYNTHTGLLFIHDI